MWCKCTGNLNAVFATVFPRIIAGAVISVFVSKGGDYLREGDYLKLLTGSLALIKCSKFSHLINFQSLDCHWSVLLADSSSTWQAGNKRKRGVQGAIIRGRQLIEGWLLLEEIRYIIIHWNFPVFLSLFGRDFNQIEDGLGFKYSVHESCLVWGSCFSTASIIIGGSEWGGPLVGCRFKFTYFVGSRLKFSIFVGSRLNFLIFVGCWKISVNK